MDGFSNAQSLFFRKIALINGKKIRIRNYAK